MGFRFWICREAIMSETALHIDRMEYLDDTRVCYWKTVLGWMLYLPGCGVPD